MCPSTAGEPVTTHVQEERRDSVAATGAHKDTRGRWCLDCIVSIFMKVVAPPAHGKRFRSGKPRKFKVHRAPAPTGPAPAPAGGVWAPDASATVYFKSPEPLESMREFVSQLRLPRKKPRTKYPKLKAAIK